MRATGYTTQAKLENGHEFYQAEGCFRGWLTALLGDFWLAVMCPLMQNNKLTPPTTEMMQYLFSRFCSLPLNYLLQSLHFHWIFLMLGFLFPVFFPLQVCVSKSQSSPFLGTSLGKSLVTASCCCTELCASCTGFALPVVRELDTTEVFLFLLPLPRTLTPTHVKAFMLYLFNPHFYPSSSLVLFL